MLISTDSNGVQVHAIPTLADGTEVPGQAYQIRHGQGSCELLFQRGPVTDGTNGVTAESVLEVLIHRTKLFNERVPCVQNETAIVKMEEAVAAFMARITDRASRGVEGTYAA
jgi:hypothetical protein